jgi:hypothetical protein
MRTYRNPDDLTLANALRSAGLLIAILVAVAVFGWAMSPASGSPVCAPQVIDQAQVLPAYPAYTQTSFTSNTLNMVGADLRAQAAAQWQMETSPMLAEFQAFLAAKQILQAQQWAAQQQPAPPAAQQPGPLPAPHTGNPPYAWAGETPTVVQFCGKCHTQGYTPEGPAGGVFLDGSTDLRAKANWEVREQINRSLADQRMPPDGHVLSGEQAGKIFLELYAGWSAGGNPAPESK